MNHVTTTTAATRTKSSYQVKAMEAPNSTKSESESKSKSKSKSKSQQAPVPVLLQQQDERDDGPASQVQQQQQQQQQKQEEDLLPRLLEAVDDEEWKVVLNYLEQDPSLVRRQVSMVCQGETLSQNCLLIHKLSGRGRGRGRGRHSDSSDCSPGPGPVPIDVLDALITLHPASLLQREERQGRLPIHLALLKKASLQTIQYLCQACPQSLAQSDKEGNHPVHYAAMYGSSPVLSRVIQTYPNACTVANGRDRFPLHLLCARSAENDNHNHTDNSNSNSNSNNNDNSNDTSRVVELLLDAHPFATQACDRFGRMPLHLACQVPHVQWNLLHLLIQRHSPALLHKDKARQIPLQLAKSCHNHHHHGNGNGSDDHQEHQQHHHDLVVSSLAECTWRERKLHQPYRMLFLAPKKKRVVVGGKKSTTSTSTSTSMTKSTSTATATATATASDLYNCYG